MRTLHSWLFRLSIVSITALMALATTKAADDSQKKMLKEAKVDRTHAEVIALGRVHGGGVKSSKIERSNGKLVWVFEIMMPNDPKLREVVVAADTGKVVSAKKKH